eukprot:3668990-Alexandrium_andersonii.AAC.1
MSASLVGSEMCIRDSSRTGRVGHVRCFVPGVVRVVCFRSVASDNTVSYTHLTLPTICSV